ncbi:hypothetical protein [Hyphococcus sp.]|uniref:calcium-binding protein n=1 Tax=Hyphococcus sp. TaxID=2038636 RepID=UPI003CCBB927
MTTFSIVDDASVGSSGVSSGVIASVKTGILAAAELWNRYFTQGGFDIKFLLAFEDISGSALARGGTGLSYSGFDGPGQEIWKLDSMEEYIVGADLAAPDGDAGTDDTIDITITIDTPTLLAGDFFFDPDPFLRTAAVPGGMFDFISVALHEIAHGLGFLGSIEGEEPGDIDVDGPDITPFDDNVDFIGGDRYWVGAAATGIAGGSFLLDPDSKSHIAKGSDGGFDNLMDPSLTAGDRAYIEPVNVAMFEDMGMPVRKATSGADLLYGFDITDDTASLLGGADVYDGLGGSDSVDGGPGDDSINGGADDDTLDGGAGDDTLSGDAGDDTLGGEAGRDSLIGGGGEDTLHGFGSHDSLGGGAGNDDLRGGFGKDLLNGSSGNDVLRGFEGDDRLFGGGGADTLLGNEDNDSLTGGGGADRLKGDSGDDTLNGRFGDDSVTGGAGDDVFQFRKGHDSDIFDDFVAGAGTDDVIQLVAFGAAFDTFVEVIAAASDNGTHTTIDFGGGDTILLLGVTVADLHEDDFIFT